MNFNEKEKELFSEAGINIEKNQKYVIMILLIVIEFTKKKG